MRALTAALLGFMTLGLGTPLGLLASLALGPSLALGQAEHAPVVDHQDFSRWYVIEIDGEPSGSMHESRTIADGLINTEAATVMTVRRGSETITVNLSTLFVETTDHTPVRMSMVQGLGTAPTTVTHHFGPDSITETTLGPAGESTRTLQLPDADWMTPAAREALVQRQLESGTSSISFATIDPLSGPERIFITLDEITPQVVERNGESVPGYRLRSSSSELIDTESSIEYRDEQGVPVRIEQQLGNMKVVLRLATEGEAAARFQAPELLVSTFVTPDRPIRRPRERTQATYRLSVQEGSLGDLPSSAVQIVERIDEYSSLIRLHLKDPKPLPEAVDTQAYLRSTPMLDADDPLIVALVERSLQDLEGHAVSTRAERLRRTVYSLLNRKDLSAGFATASEVVRTRTGDCTEHAVLLAAALRAAGIPSRVASGLVYADRFAGERDVFAFHMWTQALLDTTDGQVWVDLDATLPSQVPFDATHILLGTDDLNGGIGSRAMSMTGALLGRLQISVESIE